MFPVVTEFRRSQTAVAALFCSLGFQYATWAARVPALKTRLDLTAAEVGLLLLACGLGAVASFPLVAMLMRRLGSRRLAMVSCLGLCVLLLVLGTMPSYPIALLVLFCDGVAVACLDVSMNAQGAALEVKYERATMARLHAIFSGGALAGALLASAVTAVTSTVIVHFAVAAVIVLLLLAYARPGLLTDDPPPSDEPKERRLARPSLTALLLGCAMVFATIVEGAMNDWSALYLKDVARVATGLAPLGIAVFSAMMVLGRLFADGWRTRWGDRYVVVAGSVLAAGGLAIALPLGGLVPALVGFACVGIGMAAVAPCVYVAAARNGPTTLTLISTMGTAGLLVGPPVIGFIATASSLVWAMGFVAVSGAVVALVVAPIRWPRTDESAVVDHTVVDQLATDAGDGVVSAPTTSMSAPTARNRAANSP